jgi:hypothetical protein
MHRKKKLTRRQFLGAGAAAALGAPAVLGSGLKPREAREGGSRPILGEGDHRYEAIHGWPELPAEFEWQTTHNVACDRDGFVYVIHEGRAERKDHPSIFVFDPDGRYVRSFGKEFQGGGHGLEVHEEGGEEFLYVCAYQHLKTFAKLSLRGEVVWQRFAPMAAGVYAQGEDTKPEKVWGRDRFLPTNFAFLPDGDFLLADGYGSYYIHRYDKDGKWKSAFGGPGSGEGKFDLPHGIWIDSRPGREPAVVVCDRAHHKLQYLSVEGKHLETLEGYGLPANADTWKDLMVIPELYGRVTLLDGKNRVVARLGDDSERIRADSKFAIRGDSKKWNDGRFVHPHDACFGRDGSIYVAEWVGTGRVTKLKRLG